MDFRVVRPESGLKNPVVEPMGIEEARCVRGYGSSGWRVVRARSNRKLVRRVGTLTE